MSSNLVKSMFGSDDSGDDMEVLLSDLSSDKIGRGIWHLWHLLGFKAKEKRDIYNLYEMILTFVFNMICDVCHNHAALYINNYPIMEIIFDPNLTFTEIYDYFNRWLYCFHRTANYHAGIKSPSYNKVVSFYVKVERCDDGCGK